MTEEKNIPKYELDLFDFIDILLKRKYMVLAMLGAAVMIAAIYCFGIRADLPAIYKIQTGFRYPDKNDLVSYEPDNTHQKINFFLKVKSLIDSGIFKGKLQEHFTLDAVPDISVDSAGYSVPVLTLTLNHPDVKKGKQILKAVVKQLQSNQVIQDLIKREIEVITADINKYKIENDILKNKVSRLEATYIKMENLDKLKFGSSNSNADSTELIRIIEKQKRQMDLSRTFHEDLMNRIVREIKQNQDRIGIFENKLKNINMAFVPEGSISSEKVAQHRISAMRIAVISGIVGLALGVVLAFILEIKARRFSQP